MKWLLLGVLLGLLAPRFETGPTGSGSDARGDYYYDWLRVRTARWSIELDWWPES